MTLRLPHPSRRSSLNTHGSPCGPNLHFWYLNTQVTQISHIMCKLLQKHQGRAKVEQAEDAVPRAQVEMEGRVPEGHGVRIPALQSCQAEGLDGWQSQVQTIS